MASSCAVPRPCLAALSFLARRLLLGGLLLCCGLWGWTTSKLLAPLPVEDPHLVSAEPGSQFPGRAATCDADFDPTLRCEGCYITWGVAGLVPMGTRNDPGERQQRKRAFFRRAGREGGTWYRNPWVTSEALDDPSTEKLWHPPRREVPSRKQKMQISSWIVRKLNLELWQEIQEYVHQHGFDLVFLQSTGRSFASNWQQGGYAIVHCGAQDKQQGGLLTLAKPTIAKAEDMSFRDVIPGRAQHVRVHPLKDCYDLLNINQHPWRACCSLDHNLEGRNAPDHRPLLRSMTAEWQPWRLTTGALVSTPWPMHRRVLKWQLATLHNNLLAWREAMLEASLVNTAPFTLPPQDGDFQPGTTSLADFLEGSLAAPPNPRNHAMASPVGVIYPCGTSQLGYADGGSGMTRNRVATGIATEAWTADVDSLVAEAAVNLEALDAMEGETSRNAQGQSVQRGFKTTSWTGFETLQMEMEMKGQMNQCLERQWMLGVLAYR